MVLILMISISARPFTRRVRRALRAVFGGAVGKDTVSRVWRRVKSDWDAWNARSLAEEPMVRLIVDGTVVQVRLDRKATSISLLVVIGVRAVTLMWMWISARIGKDIAFQKPFGVSGVDPARALSRLGPHLRRPPEGAVRMLSSPRRSQAPPR
jgi:hypothetical protein